MKSLSILAALVLLPLGTADAGANEVDLSARSASADSVLHVYNLRTLTHGYDAEGWNAHLALAPGQFEQRGVKVEAAIVPGETVVDLLQQLMGDDLRFEGRRYTLEGDELYVTAPPETHRLLRAALDVLEYQLASQTTLRVDVVTWENNGAPELPSLTMPATTVDAFLADASEGVTVQTYRPRIRIGRTAVVDGMSTQTFVYDHDVEIASSSAIFDPIIELAESGLRMLLRGSPRAGGMQLAVLFQHSELLSLRQRQLAQFAFVTGGEKLQVQQLDGPKMIESPDVLARSLAFSTFVAQDSVLAFSTRSAELGGGSSQLVFLRLEGHVPTPGATYEVPGSPRRLVLLDSGALQGPSFRVEGPFYDRYLTHQPLVKAQFRGEPSSFLFESARQLFPARRRMGPWAVAVCDADTEVMKRADELAGTARPPVELVDIEVLVRPDPQSKPLAAIRLPVVSGSAVGAMMGLSTTRLLDHDVEVAQGAGVADPFVSPVFTGLACTLHPRASADGARIDAAAVGHIVDAQVEDLDLGAAGLVERVHGTRVRVDERVQLTFDGPPAVFGAGNGPRVELRVRATQ